MNELSLAAKVFFCSTGASKETRILNYTIYNIFVDSFREEGMRSVSGEPRIWDNTSSPPSEVQDNDFSMGMQGLDDNVKNDPSRQRSFDENVSKSTQQKQ